MAMVRVRVTEAMYIECSSQMMTWHTPFWIGNMEFAVRASDPAPLSLILTCSLQCELATQPLSLSSSVSCPSGPRYCWCWLSKLFSQRIS